MSVKRRGRPPKNKNFNLHKDNENINMNRENIWPISKIKTGFIQECRSKRENYKVCFKSDKPEVFLSIFDVLKGRYEEVEMTLTLDGIDIKYLSQDTRNDMVKVICKLLPSGFLSYNVYTKKTVIKVTTGLIFKIFKTIPKGVIFYFFIRENEDKTVDLNIVYKHAGGIKSFKNILSTLVYTSKFFLEDYTDPKDPDPYKVIAIMSSEAFSKDCKDMSMFSSKFVIDYEKIPGKEPILQFNYKSTGIRNTIKLEKRTQNGKLNPYFNFIREHNDCVSGKFSLAAINKFIKCCKFSTITKLYISNKLPMIIEYDIMPKMGVFQIFVSSQY